MRRAVDVFTLAPKTAFVTGGASGIGAAIAHVFVRAGARVITSSFSSRDSFALDFLTLLPILPSFAFLLSLARRMAPSSWKALSTAC